MIELELRLTPSPMAGWAGPVQVCTLPNGNVVVAAGDGGGPRVAMYDPTGVTLWSVYAGAEASFRSGVNIAANVNDEVFVAANSPGGPRVDVLDTEHGRLIQSVFIGRPDERNGADAKLAMTILRPDTQPIPVYTHSSELPSGLSLTSNAIDSHGGWPTQTRTDPKTLVLVPDGPTPYGVGLVFANPARSDREEYDRSLLAAEVWTQVGRYDVYIGMGASVATARSLPNYIEVVADGLSVDEISNIISARLDSNY